MSEITKLIAKLTYGPEYDSFLEELDAAGYAIVPKVATQKMLRKVGNVPFPGNWMFVADEWWAAMLAAAPKVTE